MVWKINNLVSWHDTQFWVCGMRFLLSLYIIVNIFILLYSYFPYYHHFTIRCSRMSTKFRAWWSNLESSHIIYRAIHPTHLRLSGSKPLTTPIGRMYCHIIARPFRLDVPPRICRCGRAIVGPRRSVSSGRVRPMAASRAWAGGCPDRPSLPGQLLNPACFACRDALIFHRRY